MSDRASSYDRPETSPPWAARTSSGAFSSSRFSIFFCAGTMAPAFFFSCADRWRSRIWSRHSSHV